VSNFMNTRNIAKEFQRSFFSEWDRTFVSIFFVALIFEFTIVYFLAQQPISQYSQKDIKRIQERFAKFVLKAEPVKSEDVMGTSAGAEGEGAGSVKEKEKKDKEPGESKDRGTKGEEAGSLKGPGGPGRASSASAAEARRKAREAVSRSVSSKGILGLLTASEGGSGQDAVASLLDNSVEGEGNGNLDEVLSSVSGLKTSGQPGGGTRGSGSGTGESIRGGRVGKSATIDDLVSDLGSAGSSVMQRKGNLVVEAPDQVKGRGRKSIYRSPTAIQEVLLSHSSAIRYCYERELKRNPTLKGKIMVRITVSPAGSVVKAEIVSSTLNNRRVERCILSRIRLWKDFKPISEEEGDITFRQTWSFGY